MNIPKISSNSLSFGRVRPNAAYHAINSYNRRMGNTDVRYLKEVKRLVLEQATNYRFDVDYFGQGYHIIDNRKNKALTVGKQVAWLDEACAVAKFNNDWAKKTEEDKNDSTDVIRQDILNIAGYEDKE